MVGVGVGVGVTVHGSQDGQPGTGHPQGGPAQQALEVGGGRHATSLAAFLESVKKARRGTRWLVPSTRTEQGLRRAALAVAGLPLGDRLVAKFDLPVTGWRGAAERRRSRENGG